MTACETSMMFLEPWPTNKENPYYRTAPDEGFDVKNFEWLPYDVRVMDARPSMEKFNLDDHGFAFRKDAAGVSSEIMDAFRDNDDERIKKHYYPVVERLMKEITGAPEVIVFNHTVRRRDPTLSLFGGSKGRQQPASTVHCDQSTEGAIRRLKQYLGDRADEQLKRRCQIVNLWRPIKGPVKDWPLAVMDGSSVKPSEVHPTDLWKGQFEPLGQTCNICYGDSQRWYYLRDHQVDEVTFIKIFDNDENVQAKMCPHGAFADPSTPKDAPLRESVEARCLVLY